MLSPFTPPGMSSHTWLLGCKDSNLGSGKKLVEKLEVYALQEIHVRRRRRS